MVTQKDKLKEFRGVCQTTEKVARNYLKQYDWNLNVAIDAYFRENSTNRASQSIKSGSKTETNALSQIFDKYEDPEDKDVCVAEYMEQFLTDIGCEPEGLHSLALMWKLGASKMGILTREEFLNGFSKLRCFTLKDMAKAAGPDLNNSLKDEQEFIQFYRWLFDYLKEDEKKRTIPTELALHVWNIVLNKSKFPLLESYMNFISNNASSIVFNKDLWYQSFEFIRDTDKDLSNFDESGAWPSVVDDFVENLKKSK